MVNKLEKENQDLKNTIDELKSQINTEIEKNRINDKILFQQNKMASMGEMIGNIAHQWRQPLMELSSIFMLIESEIEYKGKISKEDLLSYLNQSTDITKYMSQTIDDFRNFFAKEKKKEYYKISSQVSLALSIINIAFKENNIKIKILVHKNPKIYGYKNELSQVLINILNNAKDAILEKKIIEPKISISVNVIKNNLILIIEDNAGGVPVKPIEKIFEPFFTYNKKNGTGIGLFMSKLIIENNMDGRLFVENTDYGARFKISFPIV